MEVQATLQNHKNVIQTTGGTIASMSIEKAGSKIGGTLVTPAVWVYNYTQTKSLPSTTDLGIYGTGFLSAGASLAVGLFKSVVDDDMNRKLASVQSKEDPLYSKHIKLCYNFGAAPAAANAMRIASKGGTAWRHPNGLWLYITDMNDNHIHDFKPRVFVEIYQPKHPLKKKSSGDFTWGATR